MPPKNRLVLCSFLLITLITTQCAPFSLRPPPAQVNDTTPPLIHLWYGDYQVFGAAGLPQKWINILGNVSDSGSAITQVSYQLNNGASVKLHLGPDRRRLAQAGDFNIELDQAELKAGSNTIEITALNATGLSTITTMTVDLKDNTAPLPYSIDWSKVKKLQDVVQVVDGKWTWDENGVRPTVIDYDRILALGDMDWTDYEVTVPVIVHGINKNSYNIPESGGAGFGLVQRWLGHTDNPRHCDWPSQPHCGWLPQGASHWYSFKNTGIDTLTIKAFPPEGVARITTWKISFEHRYMFKARVKNRAEGNFYQFKVWEPATESEPAAWTLERMTIPGDDVTGNMKHGSLLLVAHNVDVTFGNIQVTPLARAESSYRVYPPRTIQ